MYVRRVVYFWNKLSQQQNQYWKLIWYWGGKCYVNSHIWIKHHHQIMWALTHKNTHSTEQKHTTVYTISFEYAAWNLCYLHIYLKSSMIGKRKCFNFLYTQTHTYYRQIIFASNKYNDTERMRMRKLLIFFIMKIGIFNW